MTFPLLRLSVLASSIAQTGQDVVGTTRTPQRGKMHRIAGGFMFKCKGIMYSSPRHDAEELATTPESRQ